MKLKVMLAVVVGVGVLATSLVTQAQLFRAKGPGVRGRTRRRGGMLPNLNPDERGFFADGREDFAEAEGVGDGLGPRFNLDSCGGSARHRRHVAGRGGIGAGGGESAGRDGHRVRRQEHGAVLHQAPTARSARPVQVQSGWQPRTAASTACS